jgi:hypothetical protein
VGPEAESFLFFFFFWESLQLSLRRLSSFETLINQIFLSIQGGIKNIP